MKKVHSFRNELVKHILLIVGASLVAGTALTVSIVKNGFSEQNEKYAVSAFMKTEAELDSEIQAISSDFVTIAVENFNNIDALQSGSVSDPAYVKALVNVEAVLDQYDKYRVAALVTPNTAVVSVPQKRFVAYSMKGSSRFSARLSSIANADGEKYGTAFLSEFLEPDAGNAKDSKIIYFRREFTTNRQTYALVLGMDESEIRRMYMQLEQGDNSVFIVDRSGRILSCTDETKFQRRLSYFVPEEKTLAFNKEIGGANYQIIEYKFDFSDWFIVNQYPVWHYMQNVNRLVFVIIAIFLCCLSAITAAVVFTVRKISSPLDLLSKRLKNFSSNCPAVPPVQETRIAEFNILNDSFSQMAGNIGELIKRREEEENKKNRFRIQAMMAQINPHFICNALSTVKMMAEISGNRNISVMIQHICQYITPAFRTAKNHWSCAEEYSFLKDYIYILGIRFGARLEIDDRFDETILDRKIPRFLVQPLIENSVSHGMRPGRALRVKVSIRRNGGRVKIIVEDDGAGLPPEVLNEKREMLLRSEQNESTDLPKGIGLFNIKQRLNTYFPGRHTFSIESAPGAGTTVTIVIPLA